MWRATSTMQIIHKELVDSHRSILRRSRRLSPLYPPPLLLSPATQIVPLSEIPLQKAGKDPPIFLDRLGR